MRMPRSTTCRAVLVTSIVWLLVDVIILIHYIDPSSNSNRVSRADRVSRQLMPGEAAPAAEGKKEEEELKERAPIDYMRHADPDTIEEMNKMMDMDAFRGSSQGSDGNGVVLPDSLKDEQTRRFKENQFNVLASEHISVNRTLRDYRNPGCLARASSINIASLPKTSIIIVFHNEAWSTLLRTLHSVVNRSPHSLVEEIILIDDLSDRDYLKKPLDLYIKRFPIPTQLIHLPERSGLIRARLTGSGKAKGDVLLFLDAHVEVTEGWLEPLLERVKEDRTRVVAPIIDVISDDTFEYVTASDTTWGGFNWRMNFRWYPVPKREMIRRNNDHSNVIKTPTIAGGLFAIDKKYFYEIGSYDEGMEVWGGENLEISFRVWMCGGSLEIHPCSRVGHVFRKQTPYSFPGGTAKVIHHNSARTAEVWMDDYKEFFFKTVPAARALAGDTTERKKLRTDLKCKSFDWYLRTIYPEAPVPADYRSIGAVSNGAGLCLDTFSRKAGELVGMSACHEAGGNQVFSMTGSGEVRADDLCLSASGGTFDVGGKVRLEKCSVVKTLTKHEFEYTEASGHLKHRKSGYCLSATGDSVTLSACSDAPAQKWTLDDYVELEQ